MAWLYVVVLLLLAAALWGAYRLLGTPSRLSPNDYNVVLADVATSVERAADRLRRSMDADSQSLEVEASARCVGSLTISFTSMHSSRNRPLPE